MPRGYPEYPDLEKVMALTEAERGYIAGFFDGEGWISLHVAHNKKRGHSYIRITVGVAQKRGSMLVWLHELFGGSLFLNFRNERGLSVEAGTIQRWSIGGDDHVRLFYRTIRRYLRLKGEEFDLAIAALSNPNTTIEEAQEVADNIRKLRAVGE